MPDRQNPTSPYMPKLTIGRMAKLYGLHRSSLYQAADEGRVSVDVDGKGQKVIDLSEMIRVYGEPAGSTRHHPTLPLDIPPTADSTAFATMIEAAITKATAPLITEIAALRESLLRIEYKPDSQPVTKQSVPRVEPVHVNSFADLLANLDD